MITVIIKELKFKAIIGLLDFERLKEQSVIASAKMTAKDDEFIDYAKACEIIKATVINGRFLTIEEALKSCVLALKSNFAHLKSIRLEITKPDILSDAIVGADIEILF